MCNNNNNNNNNNNSNNNFLGPSLAQGQVFRKQQQTRILTNNDVVTGNTAQEQSKNKVSKQKNGKVTMANIEPFSQKNALNGNSSSDNYEPVSKMEIARDEERIKKTNQTEKAKTKEIVSAYSQSSKNLNKFQQGVTNEAKAYNYINTNPSLLNQNYTTYDGKNIRVNNAGVINTLSSAPILSPTLGINIGSSIANPPPDVNYIQVENIPTGLTSGPDTGLYSQQTSATPVIMPSGISGYKLEGENVFVVYPYPDGVAAINQNLGYLGVFNPVVVTGLQQDSVIGINTTLKCVQHAIDKGYSVCGMTNYSDAYGGSGSSVVGNIASLINPTQTNYAYKVIPVPIPTAELNFPPQTYSSLTFGANGVLYAGYGGNSLFRSALTSSFSSELHPLYGGTINNLVASYAYNQGEWNNLSSFPTNSDYTGQSSGTYNTLYQYNIEIPNTGHYTETYNTWWGEQQRNIPYTYYTTQTETQLAAPNTAEGNLVYINYNCGNNAAPNAPTNVGGVNAGQGFNVDCSELYNQYPSFNLELSDSGVLTISNNANSASNVTISIQFDNNQQATLSNGVPVTLNMSRPEWVSNTNCINSGGGQLTSSSMNTPSMGTGQWISSRTGLCRLILTNDNVLQLEYSLQNATQDADGNLVGNGSSIALYSIYNVNNSNLGSSAHIDINGAVNPYPQDMIEYDSSYTEMKGYIPSPTILTQIDTANDEQCRIQCNNDSTCAGYIVYNGNCNILKAGDIFPTGGGRIPNPNYSTYIRNPMFPQNDNSCRKTLDAVTGTDVYSYYLGNGLPSNNMTPTTKCNLGKVLDKQMNALRDRNQQAVEKGKIVKKQFQDLFERENNVLNSISENRDISQFMGDITKMTNDQIQDIENAQITKSAAEKDSELLLVSDNYSYVILGIVSLLLSIAAIKGMRMASS
jgi:hypothetical protein